MRFRYNFSTAYRIIIAWIPYCYHSNPFVFNKQQSTVTTNMATKQILVIKGYV